MRYSVRSLFPLTSVIIVTVMALKWFGQSALPVIGIFWGVTVVAALRRTGDPFDTAGFPRIISFAAAFGGIGYFAGRTVRAFVVLNDGWFTINSVFTVCGAIGLGIGLLIYRMKPTTTDRTNVSSPQ